MRRLLILKVMEEPGLGCGRQGLIIEKGIVGLSLSLVSIFSVVTGLVCSILDKIYFLSA